ncbi:MAG: GNAT family acetyltransferase [Lachnospiraceae bacterium]|nr:GNAT family acetyltransferase [Lachnospiraceae bacterium]
MGENRFKVISIREYLGGEDDGLGEDNLEPVLFGFSCGKNADVERFLKEQAVNFVGKHQSVTYLVFGNEDAVLLGYFSITIKPITVSAAPFSKSMRRKLARVASFNDEEETYNLAAYLIAQIGKNDADGTDGRISGDELLDLAMEQIYRMQYIAGGMVVFLEAVDHPKVVAFYERNRFYQFSVRQVQDGSNESMKLLQMLRIL